MSQTKRRWRVCLPACSFPALLVQLSLSELLCLLFGRRGYLDNVVWLLDGEFKGGLQ